MKFWLPALAFVLLLPLIKEAHSKEQGKSTFKAQEKKLSHLDELRLKLQGKAGIPRID